MPEFQANRPSARNCSAVGRSGFSRNWTTSCSGDPLGRAQRLAALDVAVAGLGAGRLDAEGDERRRVGVDHRDRRADRLAELLGRLDHVVGRHDDHRAVGVVPGDDRGGQADARGACRAGRARPPRSPAGSSGSCARTASAWSAPVMIQDPLRRDQRRDPRDGLLEHRRVAVEAEQLLGPVAAALGPEPGAAATGHHDGVEHDASHPLIIRQFLNAITSDKAAPRPPAPAPAWPSARRRRGRTGG